MQEGDEDYDSSEEVIDDGIKRCFKLLEKGFTQSQKQSAEEESSDELPSSPSELTTKSSKNTKFSPDSS